MAIRWFSLFTTMKFLCALSNRAKDGNLLEVAPVTVAMQARGLVFIRILQVLNGAEVGSSRPPRTPEQMNQGASWSQSNDDTIDQSAYLAKYGILVVYVDGRGGVDFIGLCAGMHSTGRPIGQHFPSAHHY